MSRVQNIPTAIFERFLVLLEEHRGIFLRNICSQVTEKIYQLLLQDGSQSPRTLQRVKVGRLEQEPFDSPALLKVCNVLRTETVGKGGDTEEISEEGDDIDDDDLEHEDPIHEGGEEAESS